MRSSRYYERQIDKLMAIIEKQNDRIMYLAGRTWENPPVIEQRLIPDAYDPERFAVAVDHFPDQ
jgi:hypothetical protein